MTVTLATLRADFEAACYAYGGPFTNDPGPEILCLDLFEAWLDLVAAAFDISEIRNRLGREAYLAGCLYRIARDYGLEAATLYKLSDGAIDPRKAGGE